MKSNINATNRMVESRKERILKLQKQLAIALIRILDLENLGGEHTDSYINTLVKAKECSCLIQFHEKAIEDLK